MSTPVTSPSTSSVPRTTVVVGAILVVVGVLGYLLSDSRSLTAFIPSVLGALLVVCGVVGARRPKIGIHAALVVALVGVLGTVPNVLGLGDLVSGDSERPLAVVSGTVTFVVLVVYLVVGIRSFVAARRG
ncbi:hypothetical protein [Nocardioides aequoreus]|uniref:hypothetical protein n=1 Tax=Nocardioides aequoreus TaxID=397278 RepID=UPI00069092EB|nr:hypothetical protein [Nocardioides aequoreus]